MIGCPECHSVTTGHKPECRHGTRKRAIINRIRALIADETISTTLIQTSDLEVLCDAAETKISDPALAEPQVYRSYRSKNIGPQEGEPDFMPASPAVLVNEELVRALVKIADEGWHWKGVAGLGVRIRTPAGAIAAEALGIPLQLPSGWPERKETETARAKPSP